MKKIALIHNYYSSTQRGGEETVFESEQKLLRAKYELAIYQTSNDSLPDSRLKNAIQTVWNEEQAQRVKQFLAEVQPDVVHVHNTFPLLSPSIIRAIDEAGIPLVVTLHNYRLLCLNGLLFRDGHVCEDCVGKPPVSGLVHRCYRDRLDSSIAMFTMLETHRALHTWDGVDAFITLTELAKNKMQEGGLPASKLHIKPNFVEDKGLGNGGNGALFVGRLTEEKGVRTLLQAWKLIGHQFPLTIVGDGPLKDEVTAQLPAGVRYLGSRSPDEVRTLMKEADLVVFPSAWYETFGLVPVEAMSCGTPSLIGSVTVAAEFVQPQVNGLHFQSGNAVSLAQQVFWFLEHREQWPSMRAAARQEYEANYTPALNLKRLEHIYQTAIQHRQKRRTSPSSLITTSLHRKDTL